MRIPYAKISIIFSTLALASLVWIGVDHGPAPTIPWMAFTAAACFETATLANWVMELERKTDNSRARE